MAGAPKVTFESLPQSFFSLFFLISSVNSTRGISLVILAFSLSFPRILWVRQGQKFLGSFEVFLDKNKKRPRKRRTGFLCLSIFRSFRVCRSTSGSQCQGWSLGFRVFLGVCPSLSLSNTKHLREHSLKHPKLPEDSQSTPSWGHPPSGSRKRGVEFKGGSRHDRNRHNRRCGLA